MREHSVGITSVKVKIRNVAAWTAALKRCNWEVTGTTPYYRILPTGFGECVEELCHVMCWINVRDPENKLSGKLFRRIGLNEQVVEPETSWDVKQITPKQGIDWSNI